MEEDGAKTTTNETVGNTAGLLREALKLTNKREVIFEEYYKTSIYNDGAEWITNSTEAKNLKDNNGYEKIKCEVRLQEDVLDKLYANYKSRNLV